MVSVNTIVIGGHLGAEPEERRSTAGKQLCNFSIATQRWDTKAQSEVADWHNVVVFERQAEACLKYLHKGSAVIVEGRLASSHWVGADGKKNTRWEIVASRVNFIGAPRTAAGRAEPVRGPASGHVGSEPSGFGPEAVPF